MGALGLLEPPPRAAGPGHELLQPLRLRGGRRLDVPDGRRPGPGVAGIRRRRRAPRPGGGIGWARTSHRTRHGRVEISWRLADGGFALDVVVPPNTRAEVHVPAPPERVTEGGRPAAEAECVSFDRLDDGAAVYRVGSGSYAFRTS
ncbi:alpha-L-rhamnosidase C-terminal domain-containing protein [Nonomuraea thailandensis]